ncbi:MAG: type I phosphomannose isomerase catalytic subunit [Limisphaerales bacterium]
MLYPLTFHPISKERVWGGREMERLYKKKLPAGRPIGESWEISDRPGDVSVIANGPLAGKNLRWLMENHRAELLGDAKPANENRFPLLCKILDAREKLSLQVHPPAPGAVELGGEPKTEMWFIADAAPGAELFVGLKRGVTRQEFGKKVRTGEVAECFHRVPVRAGDAMFLPSGRVHAIGAGLVIFEIQQNSDTTYRVFDWNRIGLDGKPRELHVAQSLASIDFNDFEPALVQNKFTGEDPIQKRPLVCDPLFNVEAWRMNAGAGVSLKPRALQIIAGLNGRLEIQSGPASVKLSAGQFCLVPACLERTEITAQADAGWLRVEAT